MGNLTLNGATSGQITISPPAVAGTNTLSLPAATDTIVGRNTTDTLTNKTIATPNITNGLLLNSAAGTSGQVLTSAGSGAVPTWATPATGAMTLISTKTLSGGTVSWTSLTGYTSFIIQFSNVSLGSSNLQLQVASGSPSTFLTSNYYYSGYDIEYFPSNNSYNFNYNSQSYAQISNANVSGSASGIISGGFISIANGYLQVVSSGSNKSNYNTASFSGCVLPTTAITGIQLLNGTGGGTASLYGISS